MPLREGLLQLRLMQVAMFSKTISLVSLQMLLPAVQASITVLLLSDTELILTDPPNSIMTITLSETHGVPIGVITDMLASPLTKTSLDKESVWSTNIFINQTSNYTGNEFK